MEIIQKKEGLTPLEILKELIDAIELNIVDDQRRCAYCYISSEEFNNLINRAKETIKKGDVT